MSYLKQKSSEVPCVLSSEKPHGTLLITKWIFIYLGNLEQKNCVCVLEIVDVIQGDEQVNDGQMIEGGVNPEQLRMERWREETYYAAPLNDTM